MDKVPLNSLVFCSTPDKFPAYERVSKWSIEHDLMGKPCPEFASAVFEELKHRVEIKLNLGERVVVSGPLTADEKQKLSHVALKHGSPVIEAHEQEPITIPLIETLSSRWNGITVIGDIHGNLAAFDMAAKWARSRNHFMVLLGDIIDYGPDTLDTLTAVYHSVMAGEAVMIMGNHEKKIARWLDQRELGKGHVRLSDGNKVTTRAFDRLDNLRQHQWTGQFRSLLARSALLSRTKDITLIHAAVHPSLWSNKPDASAIEKYALYGESDQKDGRYNRTYRWIENIPKEQTVIVGHDILHSYPLVKTGAKGGQAIFLDTGCGKGGHLSSADLRFSSNQLHLECFKRY